MDGSTIRTPEKFEGRVARTTVTSFRVIAALEGHDAIGVSEIAEELSLSKGTVHKHLTTLRKLKYVVREDDGYRLSLGFLGLGASVRSRMRVYEVSRDPLESLAEATGEVASLMIPEQRRAIYLSRVSSESHSPDGIHDGKSVPLTATAGGKAILAYMSDEERERVLDERGLPALTENTITDRAKLQAELQTVHDNRFAHDKGELELGRHCVAAPVTGPDDTAVAAVTVSGPADRMSEKSVNLDFSSIVVSTATAIQNRLNR